MWGWGKVRHCSQWGGERKGKALLSVGGWGYVGEREGKALLSVGGWGYVL